MRHRKNNGKKNERHAVSPTIKGKRKEDERRGGKGGVDENVWVSDRWKRIQWLDTNTNNYMSLLQLYFYPLHTPHQHHTHLFFFFFLVSFFLFFFYFKYISFNQWLIYDSITLQYITIGFYVRICLYLWVSDCCPRANIQTYHVWINSTGNVIKRE